MGLFRIPAVAIAQARVGQPGAGDTWSYDFRYRFGATGLAGHCLELPFVWDVLDAPGVTEALGPRPPQQLADVIHAAQAGESHGRSPFALDWIQI